MQRKKRYSLAYLLVLLAAAGGFVLARSLAPTVETPQVSLPGSVQQVIAEIDVFSVVARLIPAVAPASQPTRSSPVRTQQPAVVQGVQPPAVVTPAAAAGTEAPAAASPPPTATATAEERYLFLLAAPVRHGADGCPGPWVGGSVRDAAGNLLAGVRLWHYDQWGNEQVTETQGGDADRGQYGFALGDVPNIHYVQLIDADGSIISPVAEIQHRQGDAADALCHWVDWQQR